MAQKILVINPGSTSTKVAIFCDNEVCFDAEVRHPREIIDKYSTVMDQKSFRTEQVLSLIDESLKEGQPDIVVGRGGLLRAIPGGPYLINDEMIADLESAKYGAHPCNLGAMIARDLAAKWGVPAMIMDPVVTDEMDPVAKITGFPEITRRSVFHALSQRGVARTVAAKLGIEYEKGKFIVAHLGGGVSIGAHRNGRVVDVVNALDGEGPFSPERSGSLPVLPVLELLASGKFSYDELRKKVTSGSGLLGLLGTNDLREVEARIVAGDEEAKLVFEALAYNLSKYISSFVPVLMKEDSAKKPVTAIILTGGGAKSLRLVNAVEDMVGSIANVHVITGLEEMEVMGRGGLAVLRNELVPAEYFAAVSSEKTK
ncbi:butyrate kinase [Maridesulfovibrio ferrireducens]|uniref:Probable butyrate kinase n=1 Tax=Maridesulfovibrio ferrireducens TaxID=246191 RepID=A0A1G9BRR2_9BACT|nr:butyrate kinase [Maridesulfovibrio ferrireducens]SDK42181.1 butyrate kinase [Maridesulfovibrio ferrireducens]